MSRTASMGSRGYEYAKDVPSNVVGGGGSSPCSPAGCRRCSKRACSDGRYEEEGYMDRLARHARSKLLSPDKVRKIAEDRFNAEGILEGDKSGTGKNCCVRRTYSGSLVGDTRRVASYICSESYEGECKWRSCREPSTACMYLVEHRIQIRDDGNKVGGVSVRKSILVPGCTMKDAQSEADNDYMSAK